MPFKPLDLAKLLSHLNAQPDLRYVMIGGMAVAAHGGTRLTEDVDLAIAYDDDNVSALVHALAPLHPAPLRLLPGAAWVWDELSIRAPWCTFATDAGRVDLIVRLPGIDSFDGLYARSEVRGSGEYTVRLASIDDLITLKSAANRDRDRDDLNQLLAVKRLQKS